MGISETRSTHFCIVCGNEFRPATPETVICPACGGPPEAPATKQPQGTILMDAPQVTIPTDDAKARPQETAGVDAAGELRFCIVCGREFHPTVSDAVKCHACGGPAETTEHPLDKIDLDKPQVTLTDDRPATSQHTIAVKPESISPPPETSAISTRTFAAEADVLDEWRVNDTILDLYEVKDIFTTGGMGLVYRVHHRKWNLDLAVKSPRATFFQTEKDKQAFIGEAEAWIELGLHPHIVTCYYVRTLGGIPRVFAEFVEGGSLKDWIRDRRLYAGGEREALRRILDTAIQFAWGLGYAHEKGMVHQDVKPANALMTPDGTLKVTDFGLVRSKGYTEVYAAPEQILGKDVDARTDIWCWGVSVLEMFTGEVTWLDGSAAPVALENYLSALPAGLPRMPQGVTDLLRDCFQDLDLRPPDMDAVAERLMAVYEQEFGEPYPREKPNALDLRADSLNNRAVSYLDLGREDKAVQFWQEALQVDPAHLEANFNYGYYRWQRGEIPGGRFLEEFLALGNKYQSRPEYWSMLGWIYIEQGNIEECEKIRTKIHDEKLIGVLNLGSHPVVREIRSFSTPNPKRVSFIPGSISLSADGKVGLSTSSDRKQVYIWDLTTGKMRCVLSGHLVVRSATMSPSGKYALTGGGEGGVILWDAKTGQQLLRLDGHRWDITSVVFSADERYALTASLDGEIRVWDLQKGAVVQVLAGLERRGGPHLALMNFERNSGLKHVTSVTFSPTNQYVAASSGKVVHVWDISSGQRVQQLLHSDRVEDLKFLPCGTQVLSACKDSLYLWDVKKARLIKSWIGATLDISHISISQDGRYAILAVFLDNTRLLDLTFGGEICRLGRWSEAVLSADGHWVLTEYPDDNVEKWGLWKINFPEDWKFGQGYPYLCRTQQTEQTLDAQRYIHRVIRISGDLIAARKFDQAYLHLREAQRLEEFAHDKGLFDLLTTCATQGRCAGLRDAWCTCVIECKSTIVRVIYRDDKYYILSKTYEEDKAHLWELEPGQKVYVLNGSGHSDKCAVSAEGEIVAFLDGGSIILWDLRTYHQSRFESKYVRKWDAIALSRKGTRALSVHRECRGLILDAQGGKELQHFQEDVGGIRSDAVYLGNRYLICGGNDGRLQIRDAKTGQIIRSLIGHSNSVSCVGLSLDERWILSGSLDHTVRLWEAESGRELRRFVGHRWLVTSVKFSPNEKYVLSSGGAFDSTIRLWDIETGREVRCLRGHREIVECATFSTNGQYVLSGGSDKTVRLWDLQKGIEIGRLEGHTDAVTSVAFSPDDRYALSGSKDKTVRLWDLKAQKQVAELPADDRIVFVEFAPDGKQAIVSSGSGSLKWWDLRKRVTHSWQTQDTSIMAISRDRKCVVALTKDTGETFFCLWDLRARQALSKIKIREGVTGEQANFSPDERYGMLGYHRGMHLWDLGTQLEIGHIETKWLTDCEFSPDGHFAILADESTVLIWDIIKKRNIVCLEHRSNVRSIVLTPDNQFLIAGCNDGNIYIWDIKTAKEKAVLEGHSDAVVSLSISPEGRYLVSCSDDRTIRVWALDWEYDFPEPADWDEGARPYLDIFLTLHTPYSPDGLSRVGAPQWTEEDFQKLLRELGIRGYGWLRPEGVRRELEKMARERGWKGR